eukprot:696774-Pyramimonas_sp.AAC.1
MAAAWREQLELGVRILRDRAASRGTALGNNTVPPEMSLMWVTDEPPPHKPSLSGALVPAAGDAPYVPCAPYSAFVSWQDAAPARREGRR